MHTTLLIRLFLVTLALGWLQESVPRVTGFLLPAPSPPTEADAVQACYGGDPDGSARLYRAFLKIHPEEDGARRSLVRVLRQGGRFEEALEQLCLLQARRPGDAGLALAAAEAAFLARRPEEALRALGALAADDVGDAGVIPGADTLGADAWYLRGLSLADLGRRTEAASALAASLARQPFRPMGWYRAGLLALERGDPEGARSAFHRALEQDPNLTLAFQPLALAYLQLQEVPRAYAFLQRAQAARPADAGLRDLLERVAAAHPGQVREERSSRRMNLAQARPPRTEGFPEDREALPLVRVGLVEGAARLHLKAGGRFTLSREGSAARVTGQAGALLLARHTARGLEILDGRGRLLLRSAAPVRLSLSDPAATTLLFEVSYGQGSFWAGSEDRAYRGTIELLPRPEGLTAVNLLSIEEYLYSVLPSEMPVRWPAAALQAQAVAARTYTFANLGRFASRGFDLQGSVASAAYRGTGSEAPAAREAVDATRGQVLLRNGKPLPTYYSANCGGYTETTEAVWGAATSLPAAADRLLPPRDSPLSPEDLSRWLSERPFTYSSDPDYSSRSAYRWVQWVPREEIEARLGLGERLGHIRAIVPIRQGISGRVREVRVEGTAGEHTVRGDAIRGRLGGLRSNLFVVEPRRGLDGLPEAFVFTGGGWGHGVGMCQSGAAGMAAAGYTAAAILRHYYGEADLHRLY